MRREFTEVNQYPVWVWRRLGDPGRTVDESDFR